MTRIDSHPFPTVYASRSRSGFVLLITLVILVVLTVLAYRVTGQVAARRHRLQYQIDYTKARYACDSAYKYALTRMEDFKPVLIARPNEPDFSDVFNLTEEEYQTRIEDYRELLNTPGFDWNETALDANDANIVSDVNTTGNVNDANNPAAEQDWLGDIQIRGPYGAAWPLVMPPIEFDWDEHTQVRIEIEDENAKYPLTWMLIKDSEQEREIEDGFEAFLEWMDYDLAERLNLQEQLLMIEDIRPYQMVSASSAQAQETEKSKPVEKPIRNLPRSNRITQTPKPKSPAEIAARQVTDVTRLLNSSLLNLELLARPLPNVESDTRHESALKYIGLWGANKVNVNTAPLHVLEAAFTFGGYSKATSLAELVVAQRRIEPIQDLEDLKKLGIGYADTVEKSKDYITLTSSFFTIRITVTSGVARARTVIAVMQEGEKVRKVASLSG